MHIPVYDILKKEGLALVWVEPAHDLAAAKARIEELIGQSRGEYVVFDQRSRQIVAAQSQTAHCHSNYDDHAFAQAIPWSTQIKLDCSYSAPSCYACTSHSGLVGG
jgi:hypothetical protein